MIYSELNSLIEKAVEQKLIEQSDVIYVRNQVMHLLRLDTFPVRPAVSGSPDRSIPEILDRMIDYAAEEGIIDNLLDDREILSASIMNCFVARPSEVNATFNRKYKESPLAATDYFYELSKNSNYIQMNRIRKNIQFKATTEYGEMDITINLSKPEKDPEQIRREREMKQDLHYPKCLLCIENEGYAGRTGHPARSNHRLVKIPLLGENWYFQYSPYVYYNEHSILLAEQHRDMAIDGNTFRRLLEFTRKFPHYFIGSNADLPIVGGSILSHDHYQAGRYEFPMTNAANRFTFVLDAHPKVQAAVLNWPLSVIRLTGDTAEDLVRAGEHILAVWRTYSDTDAEVISATAGTPHNTITPIARRREERYELDLVLRNNRTSEEHPMGIFHPHADVHHIKKENIGLIEVMGLAVLPPRLKDEIEEIKKFLFGENAKVESYHQDWASEILQQFGPVKDQKEADQIMQQALGKKFSRVLEDAGVFKEQTSFERFIQEVNKQNRGVEIEG